MQSYDSVIINCVPILYVTSPGNIHTGGHRGSAEALARDQPSASLAEAPVPLTPFSCQLPEHSAGKTIPASGQRLRLVSVEMHAAGACQMSQDGFSHL